jgi:hypothetical protein
MKSDGGVSWGILFSILASANQVHPCLSFLFVIPRLNKLSPFQSGYVTRPSFILIDESCRTSATTACHDVSRNYTYWGYSPTTQLLSSPTRRPLRDYQAAMTRKPRGYWTKLENVEKQLRYLWVDALTNDENSTAGTMVNIQNYIPSNEPPPIPNLSMLRYWKQNYLIYYIQKHGKEELSDLLGGALVVPGKWKEAMELPLMQRVVELDSNLSIDNPPPSMSQQKLLQERQNKKAMQTAVWKDPRRGPPLHRKKNGYWTKQQVISELYVFCVRVCWRRSESDEGSYALVFCIRSLGINTWNNESRIITSHRCGCRAWRSL